MIKTIIKCDGRQEPFIPNKVNQWGLWAAETLGDHVDWSSVVLDAVRVLPEVSTSQQLQLKLIDVCLDNDSWSYNRMAGRLYVPYLYKQIHGGTVPTVYDLHRKVIKLGLMVELDYSKEEYAEIEQLIDHSRNLSATHYELHHMRSKYALQNRVLGIEYETQQFIYMRMAMALAEEQPAHRRMNDLAKWYNHFSMKRLNAPTPNYVNLGTPLRGYASCALYTTLDSAKSLAIGDHIAYTMSCMSAGIGAHVNTRSIGDSVRGGVIEHQGRLPYYRALVGAVKANLQNGRSGACTAYYSAYDPEVDVISQLKNPMSTEEKKIRGIDYNMGLNRLFARKVARNEDVFLFNVHTAPDLYHSMFSGDDSLFEELYAKYEADPLFVKTYTSAREIVITVQSEAYETGRAYLHFPHEMNRHTPFNDPIYSSNLCVAPETMILTRNGYIQICELDGEEVEIWNGEEWSLVTVRKTGENQKLLKVSTDSGYELESTPYHKYYIFDGYGKMYKEVRTHELKAGDKLAKFALPIVGGSESLDMAYVNGFYSGDGCLTRQGQRVYLYGEKRNLVDKFEGCGDWTVQDEHDRQYTHYRNLKDKYFVPTANYDVKSRLDWLAGYLDADGCVYRNGSNEALTAASTEFEFLKEVQMMLQTLGVSAKIKTMHEAGFRKLPANDGSGEIRDFWCNTSYRLLITSSDSFKLLQLGLKLERLKIESKVPQRDAKQFVKIVSVVDEGRVDDTYCFEEPKRHMGMFNGILTGQCAEIAIPTEGYADMLDLYSDEDHGRGEIGLCSLGAISVAHIKDDEEYADVMYYALLMIDKCIHMGEYVFQHLGVTAKARLSAGVGIVGLAHLMAKERMSYSTDEGRKFLHGVAEKHMYHAINSSLRLGIELGNAPWIHKTKWPQGWLPIDTYNKNVDTIGDFQYNYDWEALRARIIANGGIRNSVVVAYMPAEASSKASGTTNSIYPIRELTLIKTDNYTKIYWAAPEGEELAEYYESAWDIPTIDMIHTYAIFQKFTDQAISADLWRVMIDNAKVPTSEMIKDVLTMVKYGMKTRYYVNSKTSEGTDLNITEAACGSGGCDI